MDEEVSTDNRRHRHDRDINQQPRRLV